MYAYLQSREFCPFAEAADRIGPQLDYQSVGPESTRFESFLDSIQTALEAGDGAKAVHRLAWNLRTYRLTVSEPEWYAITQACREHPIWALLQQDPHTSREFGPDGRSALDRRDRIADRIDELADENRELRILAIGCGHLREAERSLAFKRGRFAEYVAVDHDPDSLRAVKSRLRGRGVMPVHASVRDLLTAQIRFSGFDFVYAASLFDHLPDPVARPFATLMFHMLAPGGTMLIANYLPTCHGRGYREAVMGWKATYRTSRQVERLVSQIRAHRFASKTVYTDELENIAYLEVARRNEVARRPSAEVQALLDTQ